MPVRKNLFFSGRGMKHPSCLRLEKISVSREQYLNLYTHISLRRRKFHGWKLHNFSHCFIYWSFSEKRRHIYMYNQSISSYIFEQRFIEWFTTIYDAAKLDVTIWRQWSLHYSLIHHHHHHYHQNNIETKRLK